MLLLQTHFTLSWLYPGAPPQPIHCLVPQLEHPHCANKRTLFFQLKRINLATHRMKASAPTVARKTPDSDIEDHMPSPSVPVPVFIETARNVVQEHGTADSHPGE